MGRKKKEAGIVMAKNDIAIVVGINRYPGLSNLEGPEADAKDFVNWLLNEGQVDKENIQTFISSAYFPPPGEPTEMRVATEAFKVLGDRFETQGPIGRRLYIYLAGHGFIFTIDRGKYSVGTLMANADRSTPKHNIPGVSYANWFWAAQAFDEVVLFMDCCRAEISHAPEYPFPCRDRSAATKKPITTFYGFAAKVWKVSREKPIGDNGQVRGVFTMGLLEGLRGGATRNGRITGTSLKEHVWNFMDRYAPRGERKEASFLNSHDSDGHPDIVFP